MLVKCAWCGADKGEIEPLEDKRVSHGICIPCKEKYLGEYIENKKRKKREEVIPVTP